MYARVWWAPMEPIHHLLITVPLLSVGLPLLWYVAVPWRRRRQQRARRVEAMRWVARNLDAPSLRGAVIGVDEDGRITLEPRQ